MIRLLRWLFTGDGHAHHWEQIDRSKVYDGGKNPVYVDYILQCKVCGNIERKRT